MVKWYPPVTKKLTLEFTADEAEMMGNLFERNVDLILAGLRTCYRAPDYDEFVKKVEPILRNIQKSLLDQRR